MAEEFPVVNRAPEPGMAPRPVHIIACATCAAVETLSAHKGRMPAHTVAAKFSQRGWQVSAKGEHRCPGCVQFKTAHRRAKAAAQKEAPMPDPKASPAAVPSPSASSALVNLYILLEDHYRRDSHTYAAGWSDERLAKECSLAVTVVKARREQDFGPLVVDTTREDLAREMADLGMDLHQLASVLEALTAAEARLAKRYLGIKMLAGKLAAPAKAA